MPERIQLRRTKGWRKPDGAVVVSRPAKWGNPYRLVPGLSHTLMDQFGHQYSCYPGEERGVAVRHFREDLAVDRLPFTEDDVRRELAGRDLACWCPLNQPCHADVLLEVANRAEAST